MSKAVKTYKSNAMASAHELASGLYSLGMLDKKTMRKFDEDCLTPVEDFTPEANLDKHWDFRS